MKSVVFWDVTLCSTETARRFGGIYHRIPPDFSALLLGSSFDPEDESDVPPKRRALSELHGITPRRPYS
jgi:hypothetical protein